MLFKMGNIEESLVGSVSTVLLQMHLALADLK